MSGLGPVAQLQTRLAALGYDPGPVDDDPGPRTAAAYIAALRAGAVQATDPDVVAARAELRARAPRTRDLIAWAHRLLTDHPGRPGYLIPRSPAARRELHAEIEEYDVPLLGRIWLSRHSAGAWIWAWGEVEVLTTFRPGRTSTMCYRRMRRDPAADESVHCTGHAGDVDLDRDRRWERVEDVSAEGMRAIEICEACGLRWGGRWAWVDMMHLEYTRG